MKQDQEQPAPQPATATTTTQLNEIDALLQSGSTAAPAGEAPPAAAAVDLAPAVGQLIGMVFDIVALRAGAHWRLLPQETHLLGDAAGAVLQKYQRSIPVGPEAALAVSVALLIGPRMITHLKLRQQQQPVAVHEPAPQDPPEAFTKGPAAGGNPRKSRTA